MDNETIPPTDGNESVPTVPVFEHNNCEAIIAELKSDAQRLGASLTEAREELTRLRTEQIDGSDPRLADFWAKAQELADNANHCEIFDEIAEALGGPSRVKEYEVVVSFQVTVPVTYTVTVEARNDDEAIEQAEERIGYYGADHFEDDADWYNAEVDTYSVSSEIA